MWAIQFNAGLFAHTTSFQRHTHMCERVYVCARAHYTHQRISSHNIDTDKRTLNKVIPLKCFSLMDFFINRRRFEDNEYQEAVDNSWNAIEYIRANRLCFVCTRDPLCVCVLDLCASVFCALCTKFK